MYRSEDALISLDITSSNSKNDDNEHNSNGKRVRKRRLESLDLDSGEEDDDDPNDRSYEPSENGDIEEDKESDEMNEVEPEELIGARKEQLQNNSDNQHEDNRTAKETAKALEKNVVTLTEVLKRPKPKVRNKTQLAKPRKKRCPLCHKEFVKLPDHLNAVHSDVKEVKEAFQHKPRSKGRRWALKRLRNRGLNAQNNSANELLVPRMPKWKGEVKERRVDNYICCPNCGGPYIKASLAEHVKKCMGINQVKGHVNLRCLVNGTNISIHDLASDLTTKLACHFSPSSVTDIILRDPMIILFLNLRCDSYEAGRKKVKLQEQFRAEARLLGRLVEEMSIINSEIKEIKDAFCLSNKDTFMKGVDAVAGKNIGGSYDHPSNATNLSRLTATVINLHIDYLNEQMEKVEDEEKLLALEKEQAKSKSFKESFEARLEKIINKKASQSQTNNDLKKDAEVGATTEDITAFYRYALKKRDEAKEMLLKHGYRKKWWFQLSESQCIVSLIFNRKRVGDMAHFEVEYYKKKKSVMDTMPEHFENLSAETKALALNYEHVFIQAKRGRIVSLLLSLGDQECYDLLLRFRKDAGVPPSNPFIFGLAGVDSPDEYKILDPCAIIRKYASECGATNPESLRGTKLRKHIATMCALLNLHEREYEDLATFLGHRLDTHKKIYRQPQIMVAVTQISKLLQLATAEKGEKVEAENKADEERIVEQVVGEIEAPVNSRPSTAEKDANPKTDATVNTLSKDSLATKTAGSLGKVQYSDAELGIINDWFGEEIKSTMTIKKEKMLKMIAANPILKNRKLDSLRSHIHFLRNKLSARADQGANRSLKNTVPDKIFQVFAKNIKEKKKPTSQECIRHMSSSFFSNMSINEIQNLVEKAYKAK